jgi:anti-sigma factor RsiW
MDVCRKYRNLIGAEVDGTLEPSDRTRLEAHLRSCPRCAMAARELGRTRRLVAGLPAPRPSPKLMPAISARLREQRVSRVERVWWGVSSRTWFQPAAVAAILLLCIAVTGSVVLQTHPLGQAGSHASDVARMYPVPGPGGAVADDYVSDCVQNHEAFERDRAFGDPGTVLLASYAR